MCVRNGVVVHTLLLLTVHIQRPISKKKTQIYGASSSNPMLDMIGCVPPQGDTTVLSPHSTQCPAHSRSWWSSPGSRGGFLLCHLFCKSKSKFGIHPTLPSSSEQCIWTHSHAPLPRTHVFLTGFPATSWIFRTPPAAWWLFCGTFIPSILPAGKMFLYRIPIFFNALLRHSVCLWCFFLPFV